VLDQARGAGAIKKSQNRCKIRVGTGRALLFVMALQKMAASIDVSLHTAKS
jgi:hypothetical protein